MKKIAFVLAQATMGGVETSLISLLNIIDLREYEVTLFTNFKGNPCIKAIPEEIRLVNLEKNGIKDRFNGAKKERAWDELVKIFWSYLKLKSTMVLEYK